MSWWRHQMETFSALLAICAGNSPVPVNSPHKGQWRGALVFPLIYARINGWVNNGEAGDLRRHRIHYDVTVMTHSSMLRILASRRKIHVYNKLFSVQTYIDLYVDYETYRNRPLLRIEFNFNPSTDKCTCSCIHCAGCNCLSILTLQRRSHWSSEMDK